MKGGSYIYYKGFKFFKKFKKEPLYIQYCWEKSLKNYINENERILNSFKKNKTIYTKHHVLDWVVRGLTQ